MTTEHPARPDLFDRLATYRRTRTERGASLGELALLEEAREAVEERDRLRAAVADALWQHVVYDAPRRAKPYLLKVMSVDELHAHMEARPAVAEAGAEAEGGEG